MRSGEDSATWAWERPLPCHFDSSSFRRLRNTTSQATVGLVADGPIGEESARGELEHERYQPPSVARSSGLPVKEERRWRLVITTNRTETCPGGIEIENVALPRLLGHLAVFTVAVRAPPSAEPTSRRKERSQQLDTRRRSMRDRSWTVSLERGLH